MDQLILLKDCEALGIHGNVLKWIKSYLEQRKFRVEIGNSISAEAEMKTGITQGTKLAPVMFSIYTAELYYMLSNMGFSCHFYADDSQIFINVEDQDQVQRDFSEMMTAVATWMSSRKLKLNANKTECILFDSNSRNVSINPINNINMGTTTLTFSDSVRNLGVFFEKRLNMEKQIQNAKSKAIGNLINISHISKYIDRNSRIKLVHGLVLSNIDYCNAMYINLPNYQLRELQTVINSAARVIAGLPRFSRERITPICMNLHFLPIKARIIFKICLIVYKVLKYGQPSYLADFLQYRRPARALRNTDEDELLEPVIARNAYSNRSFMYSAPRLYNGLPREVRGAESVTVFKTKLKTFLYRQAYNTENMCIEPEFTT